MATTTYPTNSLRKDLYFEQTGYFPHEGQERAHYDSHRHRVLPCGRRWGKSLFGGKEAELRCWAMNRFGQPQWGWIVGPTYEDAEKEFRVVYDSLKRLGVDKHSIKFRNNKDSGNMTIHTEWGFVLECRSAMHPEFLTGEGLDFALMVEAGRHKRKTWTEYIRPALSDKRGWSLHTGVPEGSTQANHLYQVYQRGQSIRESARSWSSYQMPSWTNTIIFPGGRRDPEILEAEEDLTSDEFDRQYGAKFVEKTGLVMKEWDDDKHLRDIDFDPTLPTFAAVDYGYTNAFVWLWIQVDRFGQVRVLQEHRDYQTDADEFCDRYLVDHPWTQHLVRFYPDPARPDETNLISRRLQKPFSDNTGGALSTRLRLIRQKLKTGPSHIPYEEQEAFLIFDRERCGMVLWEMSEGYKWPEKKSEQRNDSENPIPKDDHGPEALGRFMKGFYDSDAEKPKRTRIREARING